MNEHKVTPGQPALPEVCLYWQPQSIVFSLLFCYSYLPTYMTVPRFTGWPAKRTSHLHSIQRHLVGNLFILTRFTKTVSHLWRARLISPRWRACISIPGIRHLSCNEQVLSYLWQCISPVMMSIYYLTCDKHVLCHLWWRACINSPVKSTYYLTCFPPGCCELSLPPVVLSPASPHPCASVLLGRRPWTDPVSCFLWTLAVNLGHTLSSYTSMS